MCAVHLVPEVDEVFVASAPFICGECRRRVRKGEYARRVEGPLDDGSGRRWRKRGMSRRRARVRAIAEALDGSLAPRLGAAKVLNAAALQLSGERKKRRDAP